MIQTGVTQQSIEAAALAAKQRVAEKADRIETIATRPLETPVRPPEAEGAAPKAVADAPAPPLAAPARRWTAPALAGAAIVAGIVAWNMQGSPKGDPGVPGTSSAKAYVPPSEPKGAQSVLPSASPIVSAAPTGSASTALAPPTTPPSATALVFTPPLSPTAATVVAGRAQATFLGDPGTRVSIDGASRGACPVRVPLDPGAHDVRFFFDPTGESRGERLTVKAAEKVTVRADFTGATPTVRIQR
jgi:hypothetical protein